MPIRSSDVLVVLAVVLATTAPHAAAGGPHHLYASKLPLEMRSAGGLPVGLDKLTDGDKVNYYCAREWNPVPRTDQSAPDLEACSDTRLISDRGDKLIVTYVEKVTGQCPASPTSGAEVAVDEKVRKTAIAQDFAAVFKFIAKKDAAAPAAAPPMPLPPDKLCWYDITYELKRLRATATVTTKTAPGAGGAKEAATTLITGPAEHWFLSGDVIVTGAKELKYDTDAKLVLQRDKPQQLYLGLNYMWGDIYKKYDSGDRNRFVGKLMVLPSKRPFDSVGIGVGYRFAENVFTAATDQPTGGFMVFVGSFWTKGDKLDANGAVVPGKREQSWRVGISYSLDNLFGWLQ